MAYQRSVVDAIAREANRRYRRPGSAGGRRIVKSERRKIRSAYATGIVETHLRNLQGGMDDSGGWRQERRSLYSDVTNLGKSVPRYFNEADQLYAGDTAASLSARVQRPAAQYRYRYGTPKVRAEAIRLMRKHVLSQKGGEFTDPNTGPVTASGASGGSGGGLGVAALMMRQEAPRRQASRLEDPSFSARAALPEGYREVPSSGGPSAPSSGLADQLAALSAVRGPDLPNEVSVPGTPSRPGERGSGPHRGGSGPRGGGGWAGTRGLIDGTVRQLGLPLGSGKRTPGYNASIGGSETSDHLTTRRNAWARDIPARGETIHEYGRRVARAFGVRYVPNSYQSGGTYKAPGGHVYRIQLLGGAAIDHDDHLHVGATRIR